MIPAKSNITIPIVFLPRTVGTTDATFVVKTSAGSLFYQLRGSAVANLYRLAPLVGVKVAAFIIIAVTF